MIESHSSTSTSLLRRVQRFEPAAWERLTKIYGPLVYQWARRSGLQDDDAADLVQDVFHSLLNGVERFDPQGSARFRTWLYAVTRNKLIDRRRRAGAELAAEGGTVAQKKMLEVIVPPLEDSSVWRAKEHATVVRRALGLIESDFTPQTWQAFWRVAIAEQAPADVAADLGISVASVYKAKSRVLLHLRRELEGLGEME